jgi:hypothetical protein
LHVQHGIKSGALNLEHSYKYRPLDDYLIDRDRWQRAKQQLIEQAGLEGFADPRRTLKELDEALYQQISPHRPQHCGTASGSGSQNWRLKRKFFWT